MNCCCIPAPSMSVALCGYGGHFGTVVSLRLRSLFRQKKLRMSQILPRKMGQIVVPGLGQGCAWVNSK